MTIATIICAVLVIGINVQTFRIIRDTRKTLRETARLRAEGAARWADVARMDREIARLEANAQARRAAVNMDALSRGLL